MICIAPVSLWFSILEWYLIDVMRNSVCECVRCVSTNVKWERNWRDRKIGTRERIKNECIIKAMAFVQRLNRFKILRTMTYWISKGHSPKCEVYWMWNCKICRMYLKYGIVEEDNKVIASFALIFLILYGYFFSTC